MWSIARRPRWIAALFLCLAIAGAFAALGQWQISRSIADATVVERATEEVMPLTELTETQTSVIEAVAGHMVSFEGMTVAGDTSILSDRLNGGVAGYWVMSHMVTETGASLAVAQGWAPTREAAEAAAADEMTVTAFLPYVGRYLPPEGPQEGDFESGERNSASVAALINEWADVPDSVYGGYVVLETAPAGLETIDSPKPDDEVSLNWLNIFYAVEWAVFAVFAVYLWFRLVRDAWERETEEAAEAAEAAKAAELAQSAEVN